MTAEAPRARSDEALTPSPAERVLLLEDERAAARILGLTLCHQVRNTLTVATMAADVAELSPDRAKAIAALERVRDAALRLDPAVALHHRWLAGEAVPALSSAPPRCDLARAAGCALDLCAQALARAGVAVERALAPAPVAMSPEEATTLALILVANACLVRGGAAPRLRAATVASERGAALILEVRDALPAPADLAGALDRRLVDVTGDPPATGALPALAGARAAARASRGALTASSAPGGFTIEVTLPPG